MQFSYWEYKTWFTDVDFTVVGSGIVGLSCALQLRKQHPNANILVLEKGMLPHGASTKNAGFACFGSVSEIMDDLTHSSEEEVVKLVKQRVDGITGLRNLLGDKQLNYKPWGGYELFVNNDNSFYESCLSEMKKVNQLLYPIFNKSIYSQENNSFGFGGIMPKTILNSEEGQIDTGKMMEGLMQLAHKNNIKIINSITVSSFENMGEKVEIRTDKLTFKTSHLFLATNGFSKELGIEQVKPARAQVLITKPIANLAIKGTFHIDKGYYYFRNIDNRILLGGGRNLDFKTEETTDFGQTEVIQDKLKELLKEIILPNIPHKIDHSWSGIMGVGNQKNPIIKSINNRIHCGVRLGGMGVAIGNNIGKKLAQLID